MFGPKDEGLQYPLTHKLYHGRRVICDAVGNELFLLEVIRPSIDARQMLDEWMEAICEKFNEKAMQEFDKMIDRQTVKAGSELIGDKIKSETVEPEKKKRGRPRKK